MKKIPMVLIALALVLASCAAATDNTPKPAPTINGTWTLATMGGYPITSPSIASGSLTIVGAATFTRHTTVGTTDFGTVTGTVTGSGSSYTLTQGSASNVYTLSSDGHTLTCSEPSSVTNLLGPHTYTK